MNIDEIQIVSDVPEEVDPTLFYTHARLILKKDEPTNPYIIKDGSGLDAEDIVRTYADGPAFFRVMPAFREVFLVVGLNPTYSSLDARTVGDLRDDLYKAISYNTHAIAYNSESRLRLRFMYQNEEIASLYGYITKLEAALFVEDPEVKITIVCDYPFPRTIDPIYLNDYVDNTAVTGSHVWNAVSHNVDAKLEFDDTLSTAPHGLWMKITMVDDETGIIIWDTRNTDIYWFAVVYPFLEDDLIYISSEIENKYIFMVRGMDGPVDLINNIVPGSIWPLLLPGENIFEASDSCSITDIWHRVTYWGV